MRLTLCTLTGVDEHSDLSRITDLSARYRSAEWGFLYSPKLQGQPGRYPSVEFLRAVFSSLPFYVNVAMHVCGKGVTDLLEKEPVITELLVRVNHRGGRVQLNFNQARKPIDIQALRDLISTYPKLTFITQHNEANASLWEALGGLDNHAMLFDASGGRGISPDFWPTPLPVSCGYAGGLGVDNIADQLEAIKLVAPNSSHWVDMEGSLRDVDQNEHDWLNLDRCQQVLHAAQQFADAQLGGANWLLPLSYRQAEIAYDILVEEAGAPEDRRDAFVSNMCSKIPTHEWRFGGHLGYGGKFRKQTMRVDCYPEDETPERLEIIRVTNEALQSLKS